MLSTEALAMADATGNRSQFIEELILGNTTRPVEVVSLKQLQDLLAPLYPKPGKTPTVVSSRNKGDILADIRKLEAERNSELEYVQDDDEIFNISEKYGAKINTLWKEYNG